MAAGVLAVAAQLAREERDVGLDVLGSTVLLPHASAQENPSHPGGDDPYCGPASVAARVLLERGSWLSRGRWRGRGLIGRCYRCA